MRKENTRLAITLILTFFALSFFGLFAINPTLTTIIELQKQLDDSEFTHQKLTAKITNLSNLQQKYTTLHSELQIVEEAIPKEAAATKLTGQIHTLAAESNLNVRNLRIAEVSLTSSTVPASPNGLSYVFNLEASGTYENMIALAEKLTSFNRIVTVEAISISRDTRTEELVLNIRGRQYFKP